MRNPTRCLFRISSQSSKRLASRLSNSAAPRLLLIMIVNRYILGLIVFWNPNSGLLGMKMKVFRLILMKVKIVAAIEIKVKIYFNANGEWYIAKMAKNTKWISPNKIFINVMNKMNIINNFGQEYKINTMKQYWSSICRRWISSTILLRIKDQCHQKILAK